jgi:hypothetical protein
VLDISIDRGNYLCFFERVKKMKLEQISIPTTSLAVGALHLALHFSNEGLAHTLTISTARRFSQANMYLLRRPGMESRQIRAPIFISTSLATPDSHSTTRRMRVLAQSQKGTHGFVTTKIRIGVTGRRTPSARSFCSRRQSTAPEYLTYTGR